MAPYTPAAMRRNADLLDRAAGFADQEWTQNCYARDAAGEKVDYLDPAAIQLCAAGHMLRTSHADGQREYGRLYAAVNRALLPGGPDLTAWNDAPGREPEEVRQLFRKAAARLRQKADEAAAAAEANAAEAVPALPAIPADAETRP